MDSGEIKQLREEVSSLRRRLVRLEAIAGSTAPLAALAGGRAPRFTCDPEVLEEVERRIWSEPLDRLAGDLRRRFGSSRAPSRSALDRYRQRLRRAQVKVFAAASKT